MKTIKFKPDARVYSSDEIEDLYNEPLWVTEKTNYWKVAVGQSVNFTEGSLSIPVKVVGFIASHGPLKSKNCGRVLLVETEKKRHILVDAPTQGYQIV